MPRGGRRPGAGRPLGSKNRKTVDGLSLAELAKQSTEECLDLLKEIVGDPSASPGIRVKAAVALLDRGWGRPPQRLELDDADRIDPTLPIPARLIGPGDPEFVELESSAEREVN